MGPLAEDEAASGGALGVLAGLEGNGVARLVVGLESLGGGAAVARTLDSGGLRREHRLWVPR
jgi:hypothetical protein